MSNYGVECNVSDKAFDVVFDEMMNEIILEYAFQAHRAYRAGFFEEKVEKSVDIFGLVKGKIKLPNIYCPKCFNRKVEPSRMINHLSECMVGKGRTSGRNASKKINSTIKDDGYSDNGDEHDSDSSFPPNTKKISKKKSAHANSRKRNNPNKLSSDQFCGATTKHTKKMCKNSKNCPQHLEQHIQNMTGYTNEPKKDVQIDVDTVDEDNNDVYMMQAISAHPSFEKFCE